MAPSTLGTFLRAFSFGHVRQFEKVIGETLQRAWSLGAGPGSNQLVVDIDSTIREVFGQLKQGAAFGYTKVLGYHPILATRADTGEILHARLRKGSANTARGTKRFVEELVARLRRAGATGKVIIRFDSGYWSNDTLKVLGRLGVSFTMAVRTGTKAVDACISKIDESEWVAIEYPAGGEAMVAECIYKGRRLIVRRTRLTGPQATLWPNWRHFAFLTDLEGTAVELDAFHRAHAVVELCIDDWKEGAGMEHCPSADFSANAAWMCCAVLAHNLIRWSAKLGGLVEDDTLVVAATLLAMLVNTSRARCASSCARRRSADWSAERAIAASKRNRCTDIPAVVALRRSSSRSESDNRTFTTMWRPPVTVGIRDIRFDVEADALSLAIASVISPSAANPRRPRGQTSSEANGNDLSNREPV
jgi:hypothetical protein